MSNPITNLFTGGFGELATGVGNIIGKFVADPNQKVAAQLELTKLAQDYQVQLLLADKEFAVQQASVIIAEAKSESWLTRNWRPLLMTTFTAIIAFNYILAPIINMFASTCLLDPKGVAQCVGRLKALDIPPNMWGMLTIGTSGYLVGRSVEKVTDTKAQRDITVASVKANSADGNTPP